MSLYWNMNSRVCNVFGEHYGGFRFMFLFRFKQRKLFCLPSFIWAISRKMERCQRGRFQDKHWCCCFGDRCALDPVVSKVRSSYLKLPYPGLQRNKIGESVVKRGATLVGISAWSESSPVVCPESEYSSVKRKTDHWPHVSTAICHAVVEEETSPWTYVVGCL